MGTYIHSSIMDQCSLSATNLYGYNTIYANNTICWNIWINISRKTIHIIGASIAGIFSQLWVIFYRNPWWMMLWVIPIITFIIIFIKTVNKENLIIELDKVKFIFWCEMICFVNLYINLLLG